MTSQTKMNNSKLMRRTVSLRGIPCVISKELDDIVDFVLHTLHSGATLNEIVGAYDKTPKTEMITIVDKHEYRRLMDYIRQVDPKAFVTVYSVSDMRYQPKTKWITERKRLDQPVKPFKTKNLVAISRNLLYTTENGF